MVRILSILGCLLIASLAGAADGAQWSYSGDTGPQNWGKLDAKFAACAGGKNQSPIDLKGTIKADLKPIKFRYKSGGSEIVNNGHTIQINYETGSKMTVERGHFELKQFHFHAPSENRIKGKSFPMEVHLVHADRKGNLAVIGVMFKEGKENRTLAKAWEQLPKKAGDKVEMKFKIDALRLLPAKREYFRFNGSLTTPPCSEGVRWIVMKEPVTASKEQIEEFEHVMHHPNSRPVQEAFARPVLY